MADLVAVIPDSIANLTQKDLILTQQHLSSINYECPGSRVITGKCRTFTTKCRLVSNLLGLTGR